MSEYVVSMAAVVAGSLAYHLCQKAVPPAAHPLVSLLVTYGVALLACSLALVAFPTDRGFFKAVNDLGVSSYLLGLAIVLAEIGFMLAYRSGWNLGITSAYANVTTALLLIPIGVLFFRESISLQRLLGVALALGGIALLSIPERH